MLVFLQNRARLKQTHELLGQFRPIQADELLKDIGLPGKTTDNSCMYLEAHMTRKGSNPLSHRQSQP